MPGATHSTDQHATTAYPGASAQVNPHKVTALTQTRCTCCQHRPTAPQKVGPELVICSTSNQEAECRESQAGFIRHNSMRTVVSKLTKVMKGS